MSGPTSGWARSRRLRTLHALRDLRQPDAVTCGPTCVALARAAHDQHPGRPADTFSNFGTTARLLTDPVATIRGEHRLLSSPRTTDGRPRAPWPRALGTSPWSVADALSEITGTPYATRLLPRDPAAAHAVAVASSRSDDAGPLPAALFVGSRLMPRHVVLVLGVDDGALVVHEPAAGQRLTLAPADATGRRGEGPPIAGWSRWWLLVAPRP